MEEKKTPFKQSEQLSFDIFNDYFSKMKEAKPHFEGKALQRIAKNALFTLKKTIEAPHGKEINWEKAESAAITVRYPVEIKFAGEKKVVLNPFQAEKKELWNELRDKLDKDSRRLEESHLLYSMSGNVAYVEGNKPPVHLQPVQTHYFELYPGEEEKPLVYFTLKFRPLTINLEEGTAYFPVDVNLGFNKDLPVKLSDTEKRILLDYIIKSLDDFSQDDFDRPLMVRTILEALESERKTFAIPSLPLMFTLLALFAGKTTRLPKKILEKPSDQRTLEEQKELEKFVCSMTETEDLYNEDGYPEEKKTFILCDNPRMLGEAKLEKTTLIDPKESFKHEEALALAIKRTFGAEGLRHLLGFMIGLEENFRQGYFEWSVNSHLERLGYQKKQCGSFDLQLKKTASDILKILTTLYITTRQRGGKDKEQIIGERLFSVDGYKMDFFQKEIIDVSLKIRAADFWYKSAFEPKEEQTPKYTKLLRKIAKENHREHPLTIYLAPFLAIFWRMEPEKELTVKFLMESCNLDIQSRYRLEYLRELESELDYMKEQGFLGGWQNNGVNKYPSLCQNPFDCKIKFLPPKWLKEELLQIEQKRIELITAKKLKPPAVEKLSREEFIEIFKRSGLAQSQFAKKLGVSKASINYIIKGKQGRENPSDDLSGRVQEAFPSLFLLIRREMYNVPGGQKGKKQ